MDGSLASGMQSAKLWTTEQDRRRGVQTKEEFQSDEICQQSQFKKLDLAGSGTCLLTSPRKMAFAAEYTERFKREEQEEVGDVKGALARSLARRCPSLN